MAVGVIGMVIDVIGMVIGVTGMVIGIIGMVVSVIGMVISWFTMITIPITPTLLFRNLLRQQLQNNPCKLTLLLQTIFRIIHSQ